MLTNHAITQHAQQLIRFIIDTIDEELSDPRFTDGCRILRDLLIDELSDADDAMNVLNALIVNNAFVISMCDDGVRNEFRLLINTVQHKSQVVFGDQHMNEFTVRNLIKFGSELE